MLVTCTCTYSLSFIALQVWFSTLSSEIDSPIIPHFPLAPYTHTQLSTPPFLTTLPCLLPPISSLLPLFPHLICPSLSPPPLLLSHLLSLSPSSLPPRHQQLQFRPSLEEVRAKYYRELKKFVCIPLHFRGVGEASSAALTIFPRMIGRNAHGFSVVYRKVC